MKAALGLDDWKLPIFRKRLIEAGYKYKDAGELTPGTTILTIETDDILSLKKVLEDCERECKSVRRN